MSSHEVMDGLRRAIKPDATYSDKNAAANRALVAWLETTLDELEDAVDEERCGLRYALERAAVAGADVMVDGYIGLTEIEDEERENVDST